MSENWLERFKENPRRLPAGITAGNGGDSLLAILEQYQRTERLTPDELATQQRLLLTALTRHAAESSASFARRLESAGLTTAKLVEPGGLSRLPVMTRRQLVDAGSELFCRRIPAGHGRVSETGTSGSTGEPVTLRRTEVCQMHWLAYTLREHLWHERDFGGRLATSRANAAKVTPAPDWGPPSSLLVKTGPALALPPTLSVGDVIRQLQEFSPDYLLMLPSTLRGVMDELARVGGRLPRLRGIRTLSETVSVELRADVRAATGLSIADTYSSQEGGLMATQCPEAGSYHVSETILMEVLDPADQPCRPGEIGRIVITDLLNFATPLIRYEIGDFAEVAEPCRCGRGLAAIRRFVGRERNLVLLPDGSRHWPTVGFHRWNAVFPIRQFQFIQEDRRTIDARFSATGHPTPQQESQLTAIIRECLGHPFEIRYHWQEDPLPRGAGGKFEEFVSRAK